MAKKKNKNNNAATNDNDSGEKQESNEETPKTAKKEEMGGGGGQKKEKEQGEKTKIISVVLKVEMHCEGCATKITKLARGLDGVESAKADTGSNKLTVVGQVDPLQIRDTLHSKTHKKVELISPQPKKEDNTNKANNNKANDDKNKKSDEKKPDVDKKPKEAPVTTAVLKLGLHCQGCIEKIHRIVSKTKGVHEMALDKQKETVTVKGTMDVKALTEALKERLKRPVEIVPPKKEKEGNGGGEKGGEKDGENGGGKKKGGGGGGGGPGKTGGGAGDGGGGDGPKVEGNRMEFMVQPGFNPGFGIVGQSVYPYELVGRPVYPDGYVPGRPVYPYGYDYGYGYGPAQGYSIDHMRFNDENPHACSIM